MIRRRNTAVKKINLIIDSLQDYRDEVFGGCNINKFEKIERLVNNLRAELKLCKSNKANRRAKIGELITYVIDKLVDIQFELGEFDSREMYKIEKTLNKIIVIYGAVGLKLSKTKQQQVKKQRKVVFRDLRRFVVNHEDNEWFEIKLQ